MRQPGRRIRALRIPIGIHAQNGLGMAADGIEVLGKQFFSLFERLLMQF